MKRVYITQDNDCHWYVIPFEIKDMFLRDLEDDLWDFDRLWGQYRTGGDINLVTLYTDD